MGCAGSKAAATDEKKPEENKEQKPEGKEQPKVEANAKGGANEQPQEEKKE